MQSYTEIPDSETLRNSRQKLLDNDKTAISCNAGTAFPATNLQVGMLCFRTDIKKLYQLSTDGKTWIELFNLSDNKSLVSRATIADNALKATTADNALKATTADNALKATTADNALKAATADNALKAATADNALKAATAGTADTSKACSGNSATATKATQDSAGQQINTTYIKGLSASNATLTYTKGNGTTGTVTVNNVATATNADKLDGYHYDDIINNVKASVSSGVMGAPNWSGAISVDTNSYTAPSNGFLFCRPLYASANSNDTYVVVINNIKFNNISLNYKIGYSMNSFCVPLKKGDNFKLAMERSNNNNSFIGNFVPCS